MSGVLGVAKYLPWYNMHIFERGSERTLLQTWLSLHNTGCVRVDFDAGQTIDYDFADSQPIVRWQIIIM